MSLRLLVLISMMIPLFAGTSWAADGDAIKGHKWMQDIPATSGGGSLGGTSSVTGRYAPGDPQSVRRHQTLYMPFYTEDDGGVLVKMNLDGASTTCTPSATGGGCVSAPLRIASESALICVDSNLASGTPVPANTIKVRLCLDDICEGEMAVVWGAELSEDTANPENACGEGGQVGGLDQPDIGGQLITVEFTNTSPTLDQDILVWVVGI